MNVNVGTYSKKKRGTMPKVVGPRRRIDRKALAKRAINDRVGPPKKHKAKRIIVFIVLILFFGFIGAAIFQFNNYKSRVTFTNNAAGEQVCDNILNPSCWRESFKPQFKQTDNITNALLVGIDTRPVGQGSDLQNTDTIIVASINHDKKSTMLISIPRDMLIDVYIQDKKCCTTKINGVYSLASARGDVDDGLELHSENIERVFEIDIHYKAIVNFEAVKDAVDAVGGVEVNVEDTLTVVYPQEEPPYNYINITFEKGIQTMDGKQALAWSRFRQVSRGNSSYASDFSRADRQQQVIDALKEKILNDDGSLTEKAQKYWNIYQSISENVTVDSISYQDALAAFSLISDYDRNPVNVVLDPNFGGINSLIITGDSSSGFGYHIKPKDSDWSDIRDKIADIWEYPGVYDDEAIITLVNTQGAGIAIDSPIGQLQGQNIPFGELNVLTDTTALADGIVIYDFSGGQMQRTVDFLKEYLGTENVITDPEAQGVKKSHHDESIKVVFGTSSTTDSTGE
ncbi:MAG TPA: LCP family protein [Candidatus Dojkabacteria bacterium]